MRDMGGETREGRGEVPEHQIEPVWARSCVRDEGKGGSRCPSTRTCPHGLVLVFETGREEGRFPNTRTNPHGLVLVVETKERRPSTRTCPQGHVLVFGMWGMCQTPKARPHGRAFVVRRNVERGGRAQQQKHALFGTMWRGNVPNSKNTPKRACFWRSPRRGGEKAC